MNNTVVLANYLAAEQYGKDINLVLQLQGSRQHYFARWCPNRKKHRLLCVEELQPDKPTLCLSPTRTTQTGIYSVAAMKM